MAMVLNMADSRVRNAHYRLREFPAAQGVCAGQVVPYHHGDHARADLPRTHRQAGSSRPSCGPALMDLAGLGSLFDFGGKLIVRLIPDPTKKAEAALELAKLQQSGDLAKLAAETDLLKGQLDINKIEAASTNWFVAGWRPCIGWICGLALGYVAVIDPIARFIALTMGYKGLFPVIDTSITMQVLLGLLGLGAMRTVEKVKGAEGHR